MLTSTMYGNTHSGGETSVASRQLISDLRLKTLEFFGVKADTHTVVFTGG